MESRITPSLDSKWILGYHGDGSAIAVISVEKIVNDFHLILVFLNLFPADIVTALN